MRNREYSFGIYYYMDKETGLIDYIGLDSHIDDKYNRHYRHLNCKPEITFEKILQSNPDRWEYHVWYRLQTIEETSQLEYDLINLYRPRFNFKHGGIGTKKFHQDFIYTVVKRGFNDAGNRIYAIHDRNNKPLKQSIDKNKLIPLANALNDGSLSEDEVKTFKYTVVKNGKLGFCICGKNRKSIKISKHKDKLEKIANALNNGVISEEKVKSIYGVDKVLKLIMEE